MVQKRHFDDEVPEEIPTKHPRCDELSSQIPLYLDSVPSEDSQWLSHSGQDGFRQNEEEPASGHSAEIPYFTVDDTEAALPRSLSLSPWVTGSTSEEDDPSEELLHIPFSPGYFSFDRPVSSVLHPDDTYYCLLDYPPRKSVPVGPDHQADIPELCPQGKENTSDVTNKHLTSSSQESGRNDVGDFENLDGICIIPSSESNASGDEAGDGRTDCSCPDRGSMRCVQQHIVEAREKLRGKLGEETFTELGFDDMGEVVAERWTEEEEQLFHEVVYTNPASLGKNFWQTLSIVFPFRSKMEMFSYYFNVFMLRKRAEQNRYDPLNIDSDNDEWQGNDYEGDNNGEACEEDEDSGVESPVYPNHAQCHQNSVHSHYQEEDFSDEACANNETDFDRKDDPDSAFLGGDNDTQDGSCMSSDSGAPVQGPQEKPDNDGEWHDYILEHSDTKGWDRYLSCSKSKVDLLPTCSMIKEVFGDTDFDFQAKRW